MKQQGTVLKTKLLIEEVCADQVISRSPHGHPFLDPYNGCEMECPFCYWLSRPGWEGRIQVRLNAMELLENYLQSGVHKGYLYLGSVCDPFLALEEQYGLTGACLELIKKYRVPLVITTSASSDVLLKYKGLLQSMDQRVVTVVELARIPFMRELSEGRMHRGIAMANLLKQEGLEVWTTLSPFLPGIVELEPVLKALDDRIPVYVGALDCTPGSVQSGRMLEFIRKEYPALFGQYETMVQKQDWSYFYPVKEQAIRNERIKLFPFALEPEKAGGKV